MMSKSGRSPRLADRPHRGNVFLGAAARPHLCTRAKPEVANPGRLGRIAFGGMYIPALPYNRIRSRTRPPISSLHWDIAGLFRPDRIVRFSTGTIDSAGLGIRPHGPCWNRIRQRIRIAQYSPGEGTARSSRSIICLARMVASPGAYPKQPIRRSRSAPASRHA